MTKKTSHKDSIRMLSKAPKSKKSVSRWSAHTSFGASTMEYALLAGVIGIVSILSVSSVGDRVAEVFSDANTTLSKYTAPNDTLSENLSAPITPVIPEIPNRAPTLNAQDNATILFGEFVRINIAGLEDPDGDPITLTASGLPQGMNASSDGLSIEGTPSEGGAFQIALDASDGEETSQQEIFTIDVVHEHTDGQSPYPGPDAPRITSEGGLTLLASHYDDGGEGISFHNVDKLSNFETSYVDRGGRNPEYNVEIVYGERVGYIPPGEWLEYTVFVEQAGIYDLTLGYSNGQKEEARVKAAVYRPGTQSPYVSQETPLYKTGRTDNRIERTIPAISLEGGTNVIRIEFLNSADLFDLTLEKAKTTQNSAPVLAEIPNATLELGQPATLSTQVSDADGNDVAIEAIGLPNGMRVGSREEKLTLTGTPTRGGTFDVVVQATDGQDKSVKRSFEIDVVTSHTDGQSAYQGTPPRLATGPLLINAVEYDYGGQGISFSGLDQPENHSGDRVTNGGRNSDYTIEIVDNQRIGYNRTGEWVEYTIFVENSGQYDLDVTYSSRNGTNGVQSRIRPSHPGQDFYSSGISFAPVSTEDNDLAQTKSIGQMYLEAGTNVLRVDLIPNFDLWSFEFSP